MRARTRRTKKNTSAGNKDLPRWDRDSFDDDDFENEEENSICGKPKSIGNTTPTHRGGMDEGNDDTIQIAGT